MNPPRPSPFRRPGLGLVLALAAISSPGAVAQTPPPAELRRDVFRVDTEVVLLDVVVRDKKGRTVRDLRPEEIEVYEDGVRQQAGSFRFLDSRRIGEAQEDAAAARDAGGPTPAAKPPRPGESRHLNLVTFLFDQLGPDGYYFVTHFSSEAQVEKTAKAVEQYR